MHILPNIGGHDDLVMLNDEERALLCSEIREFLVNSVSKTGGHLASNLGIVELSVAIETVFDTMKDRLASGQNLMDIRLMTHIKYQAVNFSIINGFQGNRKLHRAQIGGKVAAGFGNPVY